MQQNFEIIFSVAQHAVRVGDIGRHHVLRLKEAMEEDGAFEESKMLAELLESSAHPRSGSTTLDTPENVAGWCKPSNS